MGYFAKEGYPWFFLGFFITLSTILNPVNPNYSRWIYFCIWTLPMIFVTAFMIFFFRDPKRVPPPEFNDQTSVLCPADGTLRDIEEEDGNYSFFIEMHGTNVHVCRAHMDGYVKKITRIGGRHYPVYYLRKSKGKSSEAVRKNARVIIDMETPHGEPFRYYLICGKLARRAKPYVKEGQFVKRGDKMGIIMFGSLVKVTIPGTAYNIKLKIGDKVRATKMILCERIFPEEISYEEGAQNPLELDSVFSLIKRKQMARKKGIEVQRNYSNPVSVKERN